MTDTALGLDIGKTQLKAGIVTSDGTVTDYDMRETDLQRGAEAILDQCQELVDSLVEATDESLEGIGIGSTGTVDSERGVLVSSGTIDGWEDIPIVNRYEDRYGLPVAVENDVFAAALGETHFGSAADADIAVYLIMGTGVGAAPVVDGDPWKGTHELAGQIAHLPLFGSEKTVNDVFGGRGMAQRYAEETDGKPDTEALFAAAERGDETAETIVEEAITGAASVIAWLQNTIDPDLFVVGGGVASSQPEFLDQTQAQARKNLRNYSDATGDAPVFATPSLGDRAGIAGAASLVLGK